MSIKLIPGQAGGDHVESERIANSVCMLLKGAGMGGRIRGIPQNGQHDLRVHRLQVSLQEHQRRHREFRHILLIRGAPKIDDIIEALVQLGQKGIAV